MVLQNYQNFIEMTSNMIYIVAFGVGLKCPHKIHLNTQCPLCLPASDIPGEYLVFCVTHVNANVKNLFVEFGGQAGYISLFKVLTT